MNRPSHVPGDSRDCRKFLLVLLLSFVGMLMPAAAQTMVGGPAPEEVVVTAERRETDIQTTPLAITAVGGDSLEKSNVTRLAGINGLVPSLEVTNSAGFETVVTIRGVGLETPENPLTTSPGVALFIDGAYVANSISLDQTLFDLDHVEVLRGPQGALYGESATGGAILLVTRQADLNRSGGDAQVSYGNYNLHQESADLNLPVTDDLAVHIAAQQFSRGGFTKDALVPGYHFDDANDLSGKIDILWQPTSNFSLRLSSESYHAYQNAAAQKSVNDPNSSPWVVSQDFTPPFNLATNLSHLTAEWDQTWFVIKSTTAYQWLDNVQGEDSSRSAFSLIGAYDDVADLDTSLVNYNEEFDFQSAPGASLAWDVGTFLLSQKSSQFVAEFEGTTQPMPGSFRISPDFVDNPPPNLAYGNISEVDRKSWAVFAQATYPFSDRLSVTIGGRENADTYTDVSTNIAGENFGGPNHSTVPHSSGDHVPTFTGVLDYSPQAGDLLYVSVNRGYKPGGVNGDIGQYVVRNAFKPEVNTAFEIGSKNSFLDNHLSADFAGFYYIYKDMQYIETDPKPFDGGMSNIPSTHIWGGEAEIKYLGLDDRLHLDGTLSVENGSIQGKYFTIDSTIQERIYATNPNCAYGGQYYNPGCWAAVAAAATNIGGNPPAKMPTVLASFDASYNFDIPWGVLTPRFEYVYRGGFWARAFDVTSLDRVPGYSLVNLDLEFVPDNSNFALSVKATNVGNVAGVNSQYTDPYGTFTTSRQFIPPRQIVGTLSYTF